MIKILKQLLDYANEHKCSDVHISSNAVPTIRIDGDIKPIPKAPMLDQNWVGEILNSIMNNIQKKAYQENWELDFSIQAGNNLRFRVNAFKTIHGPAAVFREVPTKVTTLGEIGAPHMMKEIAASKKGLVLVVGPTGSGKSTTLSAMIDYINSNFPSHIVTIEDPVEFIHKNNKSLINQRELGNSTLSFENALVSSLREDPDVILVGELRDSKTIQLALTAAETGHLVLSTLHTSSAPHAISRIVDAFPNDDKNVIRTMLASSLNAVISQRLVKRKAGGRCAAFEIMVANSSIKNLIREGKFAQINSVIQLGKKSGMRTMKESIEELVANNIITKETAESLDFYKTSDKNSNNNDNKNKK